MTKPITKILCISALAAGAYLKRDQILTTGRHLKQTVDENIAVVANWLAALQKVNASLTHLAQEVDAALPVISELGEAVAKFSEESSSHIEALTDFDLKKWTFFELF